MAVAPAVALFYFADDYFAADLGAHFPWAVIAAGLLAFGAAWYGGERFILRRVGVLTKAAQQLGAGDLSIRAGLSREPGELGELTRALDAMAASLERRDQEREQADTILLHRSFQQTVVAMLGELAMKNDVVELLDQTVLHVAQILEVEYCHLLELQPGGKSLLLRAGIGWKDGTVRNTIIPADPQTEAGYTLEVKELVVFENLAGETRFRGSSLLVDHGVVSGISVPVVANSQLNGSPGQHAAGARDQSPPPAQTGQIFGILGAHTARQRKFTEDEIRFVYSLATLLAMVMQRIQADDQRIQAETRLRQAQKMESIGQLAAGVAHDFNNLLTIIQGHSGMLLAKSNLSPDLLECLQAIRQAAEGAAGLTRQLLMFSRKNVIKPGPLDLRAVVSNLSKMLRRVLGEAVAVEIISPPELPLVNADTGMIEQVVMNLAVNARDAMAGGGTLTISTDPVDVDDAYVQTHPEARPGAFVCLRVSDTGCGMDAATKARIFEPFFTT
ncbi:MAG: HAMP domain-containing protein, partial [Verrucomicrobia bacterium]|nr:HAMP domain-containing protein [Verrucomicrobiota bacterium]